MNYSYDKLSHDSQVAQKPWLADPMFFKNVHISGLSLMNMSIHAESGGDIEIMGLLIGKIDGDSFVVIDSFPLPVEGTETRVNAAQEGYEYMVAHLEYLNKVNRMENVIGWYHSHPGYGCWLSGIDVATQRLHQQWQEPWVAIVIDPHRTVANGKVEIGAFRTFKENSNRPKENSLQSNTSSIPRQKMQDYGVHCNDYYSLNVSIFKSDGNMRLLDILSKKYWIQALASQTHLSKKEVFSNQVTDFAEKIGEALVSRGASIEKSETDSNNDLRKECARLDSECSHTLITQILKKYITHLS